MCSSHWSQSFLQEKSKGDLFFSQVALVYKGAKVAVMPKCISRINFYKEKDNETQDIIWENVS